jgi:hypothetical protein
MAEILQSRRSLMAKRIRGLLAASLLVAAAPVLAQMGMRPPQFSGVWNPVVGAGAVYEVSNAQGGKSEISIAIVGKEDVNGKTGYWMEMAFNSPDGQSGYMQSLTVVDGSQTHVERIVMQLPGRPPMEMPAGMMARGGQQPAPSADVRQDAEKVGSETIATPAGSFECEHWRTKQGNDLWISTKVAPWGLVKVTGPNTNMTLEKVITDAKSHVTGTPQKFDPSQMGRGRG